MSALRIGCSGWSYKDWRGRFYPEKLPMKRWFDYYAQHFDTAEINATFYRLPSQAAVGAWRTAAPPGFIFAWKASRFITQAKKLLAPEEPLHRVYAPMLALHEKLGPALFQLPPRFRINLERLESFLALLPRERRHAIEFRDPTWYDDRVFNLLERFDVALCVADHFKAPAPWIAPASWAYVRGHGTSGAYHGSYSERELRQWAQQIQAWRRSGRDVYAYFDNDVGCAAPGNALKLKELCGA